MTYDTLTIEGLTAIALEALGRIRVICKAHNDFDPAIWCFMPNGHQRWIDVPGEWMDSARRKQVFFDMVRLTANATNTTAVAIITDSWVGRNIKREQMSPDILERYDANDIGVVELAGLGYGEKVEAISVTVQTRLISVIAYQEYFRTIRGIKFGEITTNDTVNTGAVTGRGIIWPDEGSPTPN